MTKTLDGLNWLKAVRKPVPKKLQRKFHKLIEACLEVEGLVKGELPYDLDDVNYILTKAIYQLRDTLRIVNKAAHAYDDIVERQRKTFAETFPAPAPEPRIKLVSKQEEN
jgi:hypothetical protein